MQQEIFGKGWTKLTDKGKFRIDTLLPMRDGYTISRNADMGKEGAVTYFSMGAHTSISQESYDSPSIYLGCRGKGTFWLGEKRRRAELSAGEMLIVPGGMLCGSETQNGLIYTEIITKKESNMNEAVKAGEVLNLKELISYEKDSIVNLDIVSNEKMKFFLMAFDEGTGLEPHRAPGTALITALEGRAVVEYEGKEYRLSAGESFRFEKNGLHSVKADGPYKMALLLVL